MAVGGYLRLLVNSLKSGRILRVMLKSGRKAEPQIPSPANHVVSSGLLLCFASEIEQDPQIPILATPVLRLSPAG